MAQTGSAHIWVGGFFDSAASQWLADSGYFGRSGGGMVCRCAGCTLQHFTLIVFHQPVPGWGDVVKGWHVLLATGLRESRLIGYVLWLYV